MKIMLLGASGLIGTALAKILQPNHELTLGGRSLEKLQRQFGNAHRLLTWDEITLETLSQQHVVINLAGENIAAKRWSPQQKERILASRVTATTTIATLCAELGDASPRIINANAIGIYGLLPTLQQQNSTLFNEVSTLPPPPTDFLATVAKAWHDALNPARIAKVAVTELRFGVVLAQQGGMLKKLLPTFRLGLGAILGSGEQPISWVSLHDLIRAILFLLDNPAQNGIFNIVARETVSQKQFALTLAEVLHRPCLLRMPEFMVKTMFGQMGDELLLQGQKVEAKALRQLGFVFEYDTLKEALSHSVIARSA